VRADKPYRLAVGSFVEDYNNKVEIITLDEQYEQFVQDPKYTVAHPYPATKLMFLPDKDTNMPDLLASSSDFLRLWRITDDGIVLQKVLNNSKNSEFAEPLTSFDWNDADLKRVATASVDTTCTVWDIEKGVVETQLIAHDREVYDIAWGGATMFASVSADGSVRVFDLRDKEHSTITYESPRAQPLMRLGWNRQDPRYMATIAIDSPRVIVLDVRFPSVPFAELARHHGAVNTLAWAPHSTCHVCTAGDDCQALIWDLKPLSATAVPLEASLDPIMAYNAGAEVHQLHWSSSQPDWVAVAFNNKAQILQV
ncbi:hypothetical protein H632_c893p0, partial [Helicosporidium sp. ATCC 50920]